MRLITSLILLICNFQLGWSQNRVIADSLEHILGTEDALSNSIKFELSRKLAYTHPQPSKALEYAKSALDIARNLGDSLSIGQAYEMLGVNNRLLGNKPEAIDASLKALRIYENLDATTERAYIELQIGEYYFEDEEFGQAVEHMGRSLQTFMLLNDVNSAALAMVNLGEAHRLNGQYLEAISIFKRALRLTPTLTAHKQVVTGYATGNLGIALSHVEQYDSAVHCLDQAILILSELGDYTGVAQYKAEKGSILLTLKKRKTGELELLEALQMVQVENVKKPIRDISKLLFDHFASIGDYKQAFQYQQMYQVYQDSLVNADNIRKAEQTIARYEIDKRELEIANLAVENELNRTRINQFIITTLLVTLLAILLFIGYRQKKKANIILGEKNKVINQQIKEKELLHQEIHHRVKNNLQLVSSIMGLQSQRSENPEISDAMSIGKSRVEAMSIIHQNLFTQERYTKIKIDEYLEKLASNLRTTYQAQLSALTLESISLSIGADDAIPIGLIVNEAICNAVKYAAKPDLKVHVSLEKKINEYQLSIRDNGPGLSNAEIPSEQGGFGTNLIKTLSRQLGANCQITDTGEGTQVQLDIKSFKINGQG